jgi:PAS domain S-box-containing protein
MSEVKRKLNSRQSSAARANVLFQQQQEEIYRNTDELFAKLMICQWLAAIVMALIISPYTWAGQSSAIHIHVWAAIFLGGTISIFPIWMTRAWPGAAITRHVIAVAQMLMSALLISVTGGRIETHFHVFGSLVILSFYRDWRVLIPATIVVALDHFIRGIYWPYSVYGVLTASPWRSIEHAVWVVFEDIFLVISCLRSIREMRSIANRTAALEMSEQNFRQIFEEAPIGMAVVGLDERFTKANNVLCNMVGYSEQELMARTPLDITHPEDLDSSKQLAQEMLNATGSSCVEKRYVNKSGEMLWATRTGCIIRDETGSPQHFLIMVEDISERKRAEEEIQKLNQALEQRVQERTAELQIANRQLQNDVARRTRAEDALHETNLALSNAMPGISILDCEGRYERVNEAYAEMMGYSTSELVGVDWTPTVLLEDRKQAVEAYERMLSKGNAEFDVRAVRKDGSLFYKHVLMVKRTDANGKLLGHYCFMRDITERKQAEEALRQTEQKYRAIFENAVEGIFQTTPEGEYLSVNPALARMYGYASPEELMAISDIGQVVYVDPDRRNEFKRLIESQGSVELFEYEVYRKDGSKIWLCENARAVRDASGTVIYYEGTVEDITQRKRVDEVERASKAKSEFLSRMSHELRTPLNAILGFGQLLERQKPTEVQKNRIGHIMNAGRHLLNLINEILDIARVESGRLQLSLEPVSVEQAVDEAIGLVRPLATERKIQIQRTNLIGSSPSVLADRQRLKQVLLNLLANAVKYNRDAGHVIVDLAPQANERFRISISDEGSGIPSDKRDRLFSPFDRLGAELTASEGTGLGLALSKRLVEAMGGTIGESAPVSGSCFWVEFALVKGVADRLDPSRITGTQLISLDGEVKTLLYIEDNLSNLSLVEHLLGECPPIKLISAMQGLLGLELALRHKPDLILLDVHLPDISGAKVLARLKAEPSTHSIPVVVLSADATKSQINRLRAAGASDYLTKPLDVDQFLKVIEGHLRETSLATTNGNSSGNGA